MRRLHPARPARVVFRKLHWTSLRALLRAAAVSALAVSAVGLSWTLGASFLGILASFLLVQVLYSTALKNLVIVDVATIAALFVLRAAGGVVAVEARMSPWLFLCTFLLAMFLALGKRRHEITLLEEDAARKVEERDGEVVYRLDRLGIPLIEVSTTPNIEAAEEAAKVALRIGTLLRTTRRVKRGIGTIREDVNISIPGGARTETKGVQELRMISTYVENEVKRQEMLLRVADELRRRGAVVVDAPPVDPFTLNSDDVLTMMTDAGIL